MKKMFLTMSVLALCFASCKKEVTVETDTTTTDTTKVVTEEAPEMELDSVAEQKAWMDYGTPGDAHKFMAADNGTWNNEMTFWHDDDSKPMKATSTSESKMILGRRYQEMNYKGDMMGMPFEGRSTMAFDNFTKEFTSTWIDNMGTGMMVMKGKMSDDGKSVECKGEMVDPARGKAIECRHLYTVVDANTRKLEMFDMKNGKEHKNMEIIMKRK